MKAIFALLAAGMLAPSVAFAAFQAVPETGSTISFLGLAITGLVFLRQKLH